MYKIIGADKQEYGPVDAALIRQWIAEGRANGETMIQSEGSLDWQPLASFPELADALHASGPRISAPFAASPPSYPTAASPTELGALDYQLDIGNCLSRGWELLKNNFGLLLGATVVIYLIGFAAGMVPLVGSLVSLAINGPLYGGLFYLFILIIRGQPAGFNEAFSGFSERFLQLMLAFIVVGILTALSAIIFIAGVVFIALNYHSHGPWIMLAIPVCLIGLLPPIYFGVTWVFTLPLVIDKQLDFWSAMELSRCKVSQHWWKVLGLYLVGIVLSIAGVMCCGVGLLVTGPLTIATTMYAYEDIFCPPSTQQL